MSPYTVLQKYFIDNKKIDTESLRIFEAGFGDLGYVLDLYSSIDFAYYTGVEALSEKDAHFMYNESEGIRTAGVLSGSMSIYEKYLNYYRNSQFGRPMSKSTFKNTFNLFFNTPIEHFINENSIFQNKFSVGIFNKIFHKFKNKQLPKDILKWFKNNSINDSIVLITVMVEDLYYQPNINFIYSKEDTKELLHSFGGKVLDYHRDDSFETYLLKGSQ